jgi:hypothetical protein
MLLGSNRLGFTHGWGGGDSEMLTPAEFISIARDRGIDLRLETTLDGRLRISDGEWVYALPSLPSGRLPTYLVASLVQFA